jgi:hypothetical protein
MASPRLRLMPAESLTNAIVLVLTVLGLQGVLHRIRTTYAEYPAANDYFIAIATTQIVVIVGAIVTLTVQSIRDYIERDRLQKDLESVTTVILGQFAPVGNGQWIAEELERHGSMAEVCMAVADDPSRQFFPSPVLVEAARDYVDTWSALADALAMRDGDLRRWLTDDQRTAYVAITVGMRVFSTTLAVRELPGLSEAATEAEREARAASAAMDLSTTNDSAKRLLVAWARFLAPGLDTPEFTPAKRDAAYENLRKYTLENVPPAFPVMVVGKRWRDEAK